MSVVIAHTAGEIAGRGHGWKKRSKGHLWCPQKHFVNLQIPSRAFMFACHTFAALSGFLALCDGLLAVLQLAVSGYTLSLKRNKNLISGGYSLGRPHLRGEFSPRRLPLLSSWRPFPWKTCVPRTSGVLCFHLSGCSRPSP